MIYLGISQDRYDAGVAIGDGQRVLYAANEERFTRKKTQGGFPAQALDSAFRFTGIAPDDVDRICVAGIMTPPFPGRAFPHLHQWIFNDALPATATLTNLLLDALVFRTPLAHTSADSALRRVTHALLPHAVRRTLIKGLRQQPIAFVEHHQAHARLAWHLSGFPSALCITADGMGDGLSMTVSTCSGDSMQRLWTASSRDSFGLLYETVTEALGFIPNRHEGKVTGLAAFGDASRVTEASPFEWRDGRLAYVGPHGRRGVAWVRDVLATRYRREDIASWVQHIVETGVYDIARDWLRRTRMHRLVVAGGLFANVKINQRLHAIDEVSELFVAPHMGDGGLSLGAICAEGGLARHKVSDVFWGEGFSEDRMRMALRERGLPHERCDDIDHQVAARLADGCIVARFQGRLEWGPRALGNRSVLARTTDPGMTARLNALLARSEFMPFAPAVLDEDADSYFIGIDAARHAAQFMTACFDATPRMTREHATVVHVDGTVRPQLVRSDTNPSFHALLTAYKQRTSRPLLLNTSFNLHEEPIVRTPEQAVAAFSKADLDFLALGPFLVPRRGRS